MLEQPAAQWASSLIHICTNTSNSYDKYFSLLYFLYIYVVCTCCSLDCFWYWWETRSILLYIYCVTYSWNETETVGPVLVPQKLEKPVGSVWTWRKLFSCSAANTWLIWSIQRLNKYKQKTHFNSNVWRINVGAPQGSGFGLLLFIFHTTTLKF